MISASGLKKPNIRCRFPGHSTALSSTPSEPRRRLPITSLGAIVIADAGVASPIARSACGSCRAYRRRRRRADHLRTPPSLCPLSPTKEYDDRFRLAALSGGHSTQTGRTAQRRAIRRTPARLLNSASAQQDAGRRPRRWSRSLSSSNMASKATLTAVELAMGWRRLRPIS